MGYAEPVNPRRLAPLALAAALLAGCSPAPATTTTPAAPAAATAGVPQLKRDMTAKEFADLVAQPGVVVLDVRTPAEFAAGHLEGAVNADVQSADFAQALAALDPDRNYAVYCRSGSRSKAAMAVMQQSGFSNLFDLAGGIGAWQSAGGQVVTD